MDVNVKDVDEIVRFGNSLKSFLNDYLMELNQVARGADDDRIRAQNKLNTIRGFVESGERQLREAEDLLDRAIDKANNYPEEDHSDDIDYAERRVEERREVYERARRALEEAESIVRKVKVNADMVVEQVDRSRRQLRDNGESTLRTIGKAARAISQYIK